MTGLLPCKQLLAAVGGMGAWHGTLRVPRQHHATPPLPENLTATANLPAGLAPADSYVSPPPPARPETGVLRREGLWTLLTM